MNSTTVKIGLGGGCHWCTEAVFQSLAGVSEVQQGYISSNGEAKSFSEAVIVHFNPTKISIQTILEIHLHTHKSTVMHSMRDSYRSAIYTFSEEQERECKNSLVELQSFFEAKLITRILPFRSFKPSREEITNYYLKDPTKPFCERFIAPKLQLLLQKFGHRTDVLFTKSP